MVGPADLAARERIMAALADRMATGVESLSRDEISAFRIGGAAPIRLIDQSRGIWNPKDFDATLAVLSSPDGPYGDAEIAPGVWAYHYRAGSTDGDNRKLRRAHELQVPLIMWRKIAAGAFMPVFPVYVTGDDTAARVFTVTLDEIRYLGDPRAFAPDVRRYAEQIVQRRLHQPEFRSRVLRAYERHCTVCKLDRPQLLDAAHIVPDSQQAGAAVVRNGLALCKIHHAAYDANILGITPDSIIRIKPEIMTIVDGPMLQHGLQDMDGAHLLWSPRRAADQPDRDRLAHRYQEFQASA